MTEGEVLFEVKTENLETGMRGYPVGYCTTSSVDPIKGLFYKGFPISKLYKDTPEQVISLLVHGEGGDVEALTKELAANAAISKEVTEHIQSLPRKGHPMKLLNMSIQMLGMLEGTGDYAKDQMALIAKMPHLVATVINYHAGWGETPAPDPKLGYMENFAMMLNAPDCDKETLTEIMRLFNILHYDHGGGNLSAFVGKAVASGLQDMYGSIAASMLALEGPRHGKANQDCLEFVQGVLSEVGEKATGEDVEKLIRARLAKKELVFGFGHAVLRAEDARATILYDFVSKNCPDHPLVKIALLLREAGPNVFKENPKISNPYPNVDAISGTALSAVGFEHPQYFTLLFGLSRAVGVSTQVVYERNEARGGKGTPIIRPKYPYKKINV